MDFFTFGSNLSSIPNPIGLFTEQHFFVLLLMLIGSVYWIKAYIHSENKKSLMRATAIIILALELSRQAILMATGQYAWEFLPLHLCGLGVFIIFLDAYWENKYTKEILFMLTFPGALAALITPDWVVFPLFNFFSLQSFIIHALEVVYVLMRYGAKEIKPSLKKVWIPTLFLIVALPIIQMVNRNLGTNFFFLEVGAPGSPLETLQAEFGALYIPALLGMVFLVWLFMYGALRLANKKQALNFSIRDYLKRA